MSSPNHIKYSLLEPPFDSGATTKIVYVKAFTVQLKEDLQDDLSWSILVKEVLHSSKSKFQSVELIDSGPFGKARHLSGSKSTEDHKKFVEQPIPAYIGASR